MLDLNNYEQKKEVFLHSTARHKRIGMLFFAQAYKLAKEDIWLVEKQNSKTKTKLFVLF